jgi:lipopolysaccharide/colanic/teichoic acid biosynthesis glycosyltransferase
MPNSFYQHYGKRIFDFTMAFLGLIFLSPLLLILSLVIKLDSAGSVVFKQVRVGQNSKPFYLYKFRSMVSNASKLGLAVTSGDDPRITKTGRFLRKYKLDELPQLINVVKGEISLVGPRPEVERYVQAYPKEYAQILQIKPGITDYAAIEFRNEEEILNQYEDKEEAYINKILPAKIKLYQKYLNKISFLEDLRLIFLTFKKI